MLPLTPIFRDPIGRVSEKAFNQESGISDNPLLFSGEFLFLKKLLNEITFPEIVAAQKIISEVQLLPGLYRRHPESMQQQYQIPRNNVSHDEYLGVLLLGYAQGTDQLAKDIVEFGENHNHQYYDIVPGSDFFRALKSSPLETIKKFLAYKKDYKNNPEDTNSVDLRHDGDIGALSYIRQPRDRALYRICAGDKPGLFASLWLAIATVLTTRRSLDDGSRGGTMLLAWFRMRLIRAIRRESLLLKLAHYTFDRILVKRYGYNYAEVIAIRYFDRLGPNGEKHPIINLIARLGGR